MRDGAEEARPDGATTGDEPASLVDAMLSTIAYNDQFGFAPDAGEIRRYLHGRQAAVEEVAEELKRLVAAGVLISDGRLFGLPGREHYFAQRRKRSRIANRLWPIAHRYAALLATIPTVRMVGVTGSLAVDNTEAGADIDFMLVVDGGTLWRTRALTKCVQLVDKHLGQRLCVNYLRSIRALRLPEPGLYTAHELAQTVPLYGLETWRELRAANPWVKHYLPNAAGPPQLRCEVRGSRLLRALVRPLMASRPARWLEDWESTRKLHRYNRTNFLGGRYSEFTREATGHRTYVRDQIEALHRSRLVDASVDRPLRVLFGQSYHLYFDPKLWREMKPYPPLGSLYGAAVARDAGFDVRFFDAMLATDPAAWRAALDRHRPDIVVLYEDNFNYLTKMCLLRMREAAVAMIRAARRIDARIVVAGSDASDNADLYLGSGAEFVIRGEGEWTLRELLKHLAGSGKPVARINGIAFRRTDGVTEQTPAMPVLRRLDDLPRPAWDLVDLHQYGSIWRQRHGRFSVNLVTTRGCPYHCNWCAKPIWGQRYNSRSPENVVAELQYLVETARPDHVWFMDDIFGLKPGWISRFAECLRDRGIHIRFKCLTRPDLLKRPGEIEALADAGCEVVWIGAESGSQKILDAMEKGTEVHDIENITRQLKQRGIRVGHFIQFGYPGESFIEIRSTIRMLRRVLPDELGVSVSYPLPGTPFFERVKAELGKTRNWRDSDDLAMLFRGPFGTAFYRRLHRYVHRDLAWHRTRRQLGDASFFRLPVTTQLRRLVGFALHSLVLPPAWMQLRLLSWREGGGIAELPIARNRECAARPTNQDGD